MLLHPIEGGAPGRGLRPCPSPVWYSPVPGAVFQSIVSKMAPCRGRVAVTPAMTRTHHDGLHPQRVQDVSVMTKLTDLPPEIMARITCRLGLEGTWRALDEVVRDQAALAMTSRSLRPMSDELARQICATIPGGGLSGFVSIERPEVPPTLDNVHVDASTSMAGLREAARVCGIKCVRSRPALLAKILKEVDARPDIVKQRKEAQERFDSGNWHPPVPRNPVPSKVRRRTLEPQKMTGKGARARFVLSETDLLFVPCEFAKNPYFSSAAPMRLYAVAHLREAARCKYGGVRETEEAAVRRAERARKAAETRHRTCGRLVTGQDG